MIDLHMHTTYSDGKDSLKDVLKQCEKANLNLISITDHNTVDSYFELETINKDDYYSGNIMVGIELNTKAGDIPIELLGYNIDYKKMKELLKQVYIPKSESNRIEFDRLVDKCKKYGIKLDDNIDDLFDEKEFASSVIRPNIIKHEENRSKIDDEAWNNGGAFYRKYLSNPSSPLYLSMCDILPSIDVVADIIKECGGLVFVPHIFEYRDNSKKVLDILLKSNRVDGFECYYTTFSKEQHEFIMNLCDEKGLFKSGGSDFHGSRKPDTFLGVGHGDMSIPDDIAKPWARPI